ncbi:hypothetical protein, partial [Endobacterium cereale]|uniref:hypothetical protein n=1 Tax=Endobacterium cereale TaxID=2663029 RepID=UPI001AD950BE
GWSSPVARQAHNLKAAGSNPAPATKSKSRENPHSKNKVIKCAVLKARDRAKFITIQNLRRSRTKFN